MAEKKSEQDIKKSVEETVNQILSADASAANGGATQEIADPTVTKAMPSSTPANGGDDKIKSGSPMTEEEKAEEAKKAKAADDEKKKKEEDEAKKAMSAKEDEEKKEKEACKSKDKMKKSLEELSSILDEEELELIKTWREETAPVAEEPVAKSAAAPAMQMADLHEVLKKAIAEGTADIKKALDEKDTLIKGLNDKIEKMASQPAYDRRSISTLETLEKSGAQASGELTKSQVLDKMLELQAAGKGVTSHHIAEFETTRNISDPAVRGIVFRELKLN